MWFVGCGLRELGITLGEREAERLKDCSISWDESGFTELGRMENRCKANKFAGVVKIRDKLDKQQE